MAQHCLPWPVAQQFIGCLCHFIKYVLEEEHMHRLKRPETQSFHSQLELCCDKGNVGWSAGNASQDAQSLCRGGLFVEEVKHYYHLRDMLEEIMECSLLCRNRATPLYLKIAVWRDDSKGVANRSENSTHEQKSTAQLNLLNGLIKSTGESPCTRRVSYAGTKSV